MNKARYSIGIDLGTTHCALAFVDSQESDGDHLVEAVLPIPQLTAPGAVMGRPLLPSFLYLPHPDEFRSGDLTLPWTSDPSRIGGELARAQGATTPIRLVSSAKSWLCHPDLDRRAAILPDGAPDDVPKVSPYEASVQFLAHLRDAWNVRYPNDPLEAPRGHGHGARLV